MIVYGKKSPDAGFRVPVISFSIKDQSSREFVEKVEACSDFGIRWGFFYSKKLVDELLDLKPDGVIRVSMVHYNTGMSCVLLFSKLLSGGLAIIRSQC